MNRERAKELLPIIQAYSEGVKIQYKHNNDSQWSDVSITTDVGFYCSYEYRIKPEPKEFYISFNDDCVFNVSGHKEDLESCSDRRIAKFKEVVD